MVPRPSRDLVRPRGGPHAVAGLEGSSSGSRFAEVSLSSSRVRLASVARSSSRRRSRCPDRRALTPTAFATATAKPHVSPTVPIPRRRHYAATTPPPATALQNKPAPQPPSPLSRSLCSQHTVSPKVTTYTLYTWVEEGDSAQRPNGCRLQSRATGWLGFKQAMKSGQRSAPSLASRRSASRSVASLSARSAGAPVAQRQTLTGYSSRLTTRAR